MAGSRSIPKRATKARNKSVPEQMEFPLPPAEEKDAYLHVKVSSSFKWRMKLQMMHLESAGEKTTITDWVKGCIEENLEKAERERMRKGR